MSVAKATTQRPPLPPFICETAIEKVRLAEDAWNSRDPEKVALAYTVDFTLEKPLIICERKARNRRVSQTQNERRNWTIG